MDSKVKVLLVDDDEMVRRGVVRVLKRRNADIQEARDGLEALEALRTGTFDVVVCDVSMPRMSGPEFLRQARVERLPTGTFVFHTGQPESVQGLGVPVIAKGQLTDLAALVERAKA